MYYFRKANKNEFTDIICILDLISVSILPECIICTGQKSVLDYLEPML